MTEILIHISSSPESQIYKINWDADATRESDSIKAETDGKNAVMIGRLENILKGELQATDTDKRFYTHEIRERERYRNLGVKDGECPVNKSDVWNNTHTATLEDYKINEKREPLYTSEAIEAQPKAEEGH